MDRYSLYQKPFREQLLMEAQAMARYAATSGYPLPGNLVSILEDFIDENNNAGIAKRIKKEGEEAQELDIALLASVHAHLSQIIAPANPATISLISSEIKQDRWFLFLSPIPLIRRLMLAALIFVVLLIIISMSSVVTAGMGTNAFINLTVTSVLVSFTAAGVGASFSALYRANKYVTKGVYDSKYDSTYWAEFFLGIVAGILLAEYFYFNIAEIFGTESWAGLNKVILAIVGGFASEVIYKIIMRIIGAIDSFLSSSPRALETKTKELVEAEYKQKMAAMKTKMVMELNEVKVKANLGDEVGVKRDIDNIIDEYVPARKTFEYEFPVNNSTNGISSGSSDEPMRVQVNEDDSEAEMRDLDEGLYEADEVDNYREMDFLKNQGDYTNGQESSSQV